jgi:hypothetical protein
MLHHLSSLSRFSVAGVVVSFAEFKLVFCCGCYSAIGRPARALEVVTEEREAVGLDVVLDVDGTQMDAQVGHEVKDLTFGQVTAIEGVAFPDQGEVGVATVVAVRGGVGGGS